MSRKKDDQTSTSRTNANTSMRMGTDDVAIKSTTSHGNRNTTSVKDKKNDSNGSDSPVMEGIVQLLNQVNRQYQEKSNLQVKLKRLDDSIRNTNESISNAKAETIRFNDEQRQLIKEVDAIEAKIFSHEESLNEERHSKSQLSLSSKNIAEKTNLLISSNIELKEKFNNKMIESIKNNDENNKFINAVKDNDEVMGILKKEFFPGNERAMEVTNQNQDDTYAQTL